MPLFALFFAVLVLLLAGWVIYYAMFRPKGS